MYVPSYGTPRLVVTGQVALRVSCNLEMHNYNWNTREVGTSDGTSKMMYLLCCFFVNKTVRSVNKDFACTVSTFLALTFTAACFYRIHHLLAVLCCFYVNRLREYFQIHFLFEIRDLNMHTQTRTFTLN